MISTTPYPQLERFRNRTCMREPQAGTTGGDYREEERYAKRGPQKRLLGDLDGPGRGWESRGTNLVWEKGSEYFCPCCVV